MLRVRRLLHLIPGTRLPLFPLRAEHQEPVLRRQTGILQRKLTILHGI